MPADSGNARPDKLSVVVYSGAFDKVHYALSMAAAAVAVGTPATLFFTMGACRALIAAGADGAPAWAALGVSEGAGTGAERDADYRARGVAGFDELLRACADLGVRFIVCEMGLRAMGLARRDLRDDVAFEAAGLVTFLNDASRDGAMVFV